MAIATRLGSDDLYRDPFPIYRRLRDDEPWAWSERLGVWLVSRYDDVVFVDEHPEIFTAHQRESLAERAMGLVMIRTDGDAHRRLRAAVDGPLKRRNVRQRWSAELLGIAGELLARIAPQGGCDLVRDFAAPFAARSLTRVIGLPEVTTEQVVEWSGAFIAGLSNHAGDPAVWRRCDRARAEVGALVAAEVGTGGREGSVIAAMANSPLSVEEIATQVRLMLSGGFNEPWHALTTLVWQLLRHPEIAWDVHEDSGALDAAIAETVRWLTPIGALPRQLAVDHHAGDVTLRAGDKLLALAASANHDERKFGDPEAFDPGRPGLGDHLAFSLGAHYCLGTYLAREQLRVAAPLLLTRLPGLRVAEPPEFTGWMFRGPEALQVRYDAVRQV
ncbi:cytochrome P450 [Sinosporangium siamense]|uniref:Cytochrome P450 n=1 Tax=Sinosporangium siamense TaxID=1367973 RepID=A0A919RL46_9ACTN|nr:cytochrome P450 [Sinosporangium siamense]GII95202.1 cytochrome P450 [Sinosporangium siamense]